MNRICIQVQQWNDSKGSIVIYGYNNNGSKDGNQSDYLWNNYLPIIAWNILSVFIIIIIIKLESTRSFPIFFLYLALDFFLFVIIIVLQQQQHHHHPIEFNIMPMTMTTRESSSSSVVMTATFNLKKKFISSNLTKGWYKFNEWRNDDSSCCLVFKFFWYEKFVPGPNMRNRINIDHHQHGHHCLSSSMLSKDRKVLSPS